MICVCLLSGGYAMSEWSIFVMRSMEKGIKSGLSVHFIKKESVYREVFYGTAK